MPIIEKFGGLIPRQSDHELPKNAATIAHNVKLRNGRIEAWREKLPISLASAEALTLHMWGCCSFTWPTCVSAAEYLPDYDRLFLTGRTEYPEVMIAEDCYPQYLPLGVPAPETALVASGAESDGEASDQRTYVYTYINVFGEESAPSPPSNPLTMRDGDSVTLTGWSAAPAGYGIVAIAYYRTATGSRTGAEKEQTPVTDYLLVDTLTDLAPAAVTDARLMRDLGQAIVTRENAMPPAGLRHISHLNGTMQLVGVTTNQVHFSENGEPANWPARYVKTLPANIVHMVTLDSWIFISTDGKPFVVDGSYNCENPAFHAVRDVDTALPDIGCGYAHSAIATPFGMVYSSWDGLILLKSDATFDIITAAWFSTDEWAKVRPDTVRLAYWRGQLFCVTENLSFILSIDGNNYGDYQLGAMTTVSDKPVDMHVTKGGVLLMLEDNIIQQWDGARTYRPYQWESRELTFGGESSPPAAKVRAKDTTFRLLTPWPDVFYERKILNDEPFRLGRVGRHFFYKIGFYGTGPVDFAEIGTTLTTVSKGA